MQLHNYESTFCLIKAKQASQGAEKRPSNIAQKAIQDRLEIIFLFVAVMRITRGEGPDHPVM